MKKQKNRNCKKEKSAEKENKRRRMDGEADGTG